MSSSNNTLKPEHESIPQVQTSVFQEASQQQKYQNQREVQTTPHVSDGGSRRYSLKTSGGRQVATPKTPGVFVVKGTSRRSIRRRESQREQRKRLIRHLRIVLSKTHENDANPYIYNSMPQTSFNFELDENQERGNWSGRLDFLLSCIGYAVGLGNLWRFPSLCFRHGGGAFLVPYTIFLLLCGVPMFLLDLSLGQFTSEGPATCWEFAPILNGVGYAMTYLSMLVAAYYNMIIAYSIYYLFASMSSSLPWASCKNAWNTPMCSDLWPLVNCSSEGMQPNGTCYNGTKLLGVYNNSIFQQTTNMRKILPAEEYFNREVLKSSGSIDHFGTPDWKLALSLLAGWLMVFGCMLKGIKAMGKIVYFTALFPYVILLVMFFRGITLSNAAEGIKFYIVPNFSKLTNAEVWKDAAGQIFFTLSCSTGGLTSLASYNRFHNNVVKDTLIVTMANSATSIFAGFVVFSYLGHLAGSLGLEVKDVTETGFGLAFVIYPEAIKMLPGSTMWALAFFLMLIFIGLDSEFANIETICTSMSDTMKILRRHRPIVIGCVCLFLYMMGLLFTCSGGFYLLTIFDCYGGSWLLILLGFIECTALVWLYGRPGLGRFHRFSLDISLMMRRPIWAGWHYLWQLVTPIVLLSIIIFYWVDYSRTRYPDGTFYPVWADVLGWVIVIISVLIILLTALFKLLAEPSSSPWSERIFNLSIPSYKWGPALPRHRMLMAPYLYHLGALDHFYLCPRNQIKFCEVFPLEKGGHNDRATAPLPAESESATATEESRRLPFAELHFSLDPSTSSESQASPAVYLTTHSTQV